MANFRNTKAHSWNTSLASDPEMMESEDSIMNLFFEDKKSNYYSKWVALLIMPLTLDLISKAAAKNDHKQGGSKQWKCVLLQLWRLDVWNQGASRALLPSESPEVWSSLLRPPLAAPGIARLMDASLLTACLHMMFPLYVCVWSSLFIYQ